MSPSEAAKFIQKLEPDDDIQIVIVGKTPKLTEAQIGGTLESSESFQKLTAALEANTASIIRLAEIPAGAVLSHAND